MNRIQLEDPRDYLEWRDGGGGTVEIFDIVVGSSRRNGIGRLMVSTLLDMVANNHSPLTVVWAITRTENLIAQQFYESMNFEVIGVLRRFYSYEGDKVDAIVYGRPAIIP